MYTFIVQCATCGQPIELADDDGWFDSTGAKFCVKTYDPNDAGSAHAPGDAKFHS